MLLWLAIRGNIDRINYAYAIYHGRFGKANSDLICTGISMIWLLGDGNVFYVSPAHSEILIISMEYLLGRKLL